MDDFGEQMDDIPAKDRNIVLTGFMGTGKSTVGRIVAEKLGVEFVDSDEVIEERFGPIRRIFALDGEPGFRQRERVVAEDLASKRNTVIATGGGMLLDPVSVEMFEASGVIFCLRADPAAILDRVLGDGSVDRPLLSSTDPRRRIVELLAEREEAYARFRSIITDAKSPEAIADEIIRSCRDGE